MSSFSIWSRVAKLLETRYISVTRAKGGKNEESIYAAHSLRRGPDQGKRK